MRSHLLVIGRLLAGGLTVAAISIVAIVALSGANAANYAPSASACLDDETTADPDPFSSGSPYACDGNNAPKGTSSIVRTLTIDEGDAMFDDVVFFTPPEWSIAGDDDLPDGSAVGSVQLQITLGLLNSSCSTQLPVIFDLMEATTDESDIVLFNEAYKSANFDHEQFQTVDGVPRGVTEYPDYLLRILEDSNGNPLQPRARYYGQVVITGVPWSLNILTFEPGITLRGRHFDPSYGYPGILVVNNNGDPDIKPAPSAITDFCSPFQMSTTIFGKVGGTEVFVNPEKEAYYAFVTYTSSGRDADDDGFENGLDTCPYTPNPNWDPRSETPPGQPFPGDTDRDGIPDNCDPLPDNAGSPEGAIYDYDGDNYYNRQDNCPLDKNNAASPIFFGDNGPDTQGDDDLDGIGNVCDQHPDEPDGQLNELCSVTEVVIGAGGDHSAPGGPPCGGEPPPTPTPIPTPIIEPSPLPTPTPTPGSLPEAGGPYNHSNWHTQWLVFFGITLATAVLAAGSATVMAALRRR